MNKAPRYVTCPRCRARVLEVRWDFQMDVLIGMPLLDPVALQPLQIVACVITRVQLWQIHEHAGKTITSQRTPWWPRKPVDGEISPRHRCGHTWDAPALDLVPDEVVYPDQPPF
jgi:hypothetical protein